MSSHNLPRILMVSAAFAALAACSSGGDGGSDTGYISLGVTDAPVDVADAVVVQFTGVELKPKAGSAFSIDFATPKTIDLMGYQNGERAMLLDGEEVPAGEYNWMRLKVVADPDVAGDSYITIGDADCELRIPSGDERGLQMIRGFTVGVGTTTDFTVDFMLRQSVLQPPGQTTTVPVCDGQAYHLKPVVRLVDNLEVGTITGAVDSTFITEQCGPVEMQSGVYPGNVYLFGPVAEGATVTPDDYDIVASDPRPQRRERAHERDGERDRLHLHHRFRAGRQLRGRLHLRPRCPGRRRERTPTAQLPRRTKWSSSRRPAVRR